MDIDRAILKALLNGNHVLRFGQMYVVIALKYHRFYWSLSLLFVICFVCLFVCLFVYFQRSQRFAFSSIESRFDMESSRYRQVRNIQGGSQVGGDS